MNKKEIILDATYELFAHKGYNLSMSDIAKKVGLKTPSLYSHYESKAEIVSLTIEREIIIYCHKLNTRISELESCNCEEKLKQILLFIINYGSI